MKGLGGVRRISLLQPAGKDWSEGAESRSHRRADISRSCLLEMREMERNREEEGEVAKIDEGREGGQAIKQAIERQWEEER